MNRRNEYLFKKLLRIGNKCIVEYRIYVHK